MAPKVKRECEDCGETYYVAPTYPLNICHVCRSELEDDGIDPNHKQPNDKSEYRPRYNGMKPYGY